MIEVALILWWCAMCVCFLAMAIDYRDLGSWFYDHVATRKAGGPVLFRTLAGVAGTLGLALVAVEIVTR